ncbi:MAG: WXG100 family type VII secretion target [Cellulomonadaceae bacterium]
MSRFQVDVEQVEWASAKTRASVETIRGEVQAMMGHLADLRASWQGGAATAFEGLMEQWSGAQAQVEQTLSEITVALDRTAQTYAQTEQDNMRLFAG